MIERGKQIYLCKPNLEHITVLNGIKLETVSYGKYAKDYQTLSFDVDEYTIINNKKIQSNGYDLLDIYMYLYVQDIGYFQIQAPEIHNDGTSEYKTIIAYSIEKEFEDTDFVGFKVNTGESDSLEKIVDGNVDELGFCKEFITFYNPRKPELSLIHLILEKMPRWSVVDEDIDRALWDKKLSFNESTNMYALLTATIAPRAECIFLFDIKNMRIKAVWKNNLEYDTNVFIGYRNLVNSVDITVDEDSVYTRFNCQGDDDLTLEDCNYGDSRIYNIDYFTKEPYMDSALVGKINQWTSWRENNREQYIELGKNRADVQEKITEIEYRVPNDGCSYKQWDNMDEETLQKNLEYYEAVIESLQVSVDTRAESEMYTNYTDKQNREYRPYRKSNGEVDHDRYLQLLYDEANGYGGYYTYLQINEYIIPNIKTAQKNIGVPKDQKLEYNDDYETNWDLYGTIELKNKKKVYEEKVEALSEYSKSWASLTEEERTKYTSEEMYNKKHDLYVEYNGYISQINSKISQLEREINNLQSQLDNYDSQRKTMMNQASMYYKDNGNTVYNFGFTNADIILIHTLFHDTDYVNSNIITTSADSSRQKIDRERELFEDSVSKLSEVSQPQYKFTVSMDNLFAIDEFKDWKDDFDILKYFHLGIRDDYSVKLRLISIEYNICETTGDITVGFSNMITSASGRSDLTEMIDNENYRGAKNSISVGVGNLNQEDVTRLLQVLVSTNAFNSSVVGVIGDNAGEVGTIIGDYLEVDEINVGKITGDEAQFNELFSKYIDADYINARVVIAETGQFQALSTELANIKSALMGTSVTETGIVMNLNASNATIDNAFLKDLIAENIAVSDLLAGDIVVSDTLRIKSQNENGGNMVISGSAMQFTDADGNVGIQIGYGNNDKPSIIIKDEQGTLLMDSTGITENAIADGLIVNNMIKEGSISEDKLSFNVETDADGNIITSIEHIYDANGNKWGVEYTEFVTSTNNKLDNIDATIEQKVDDNTAFTIQIYSTNGYDFYYGNTETYLEVTLYKGSKDVTDQYDSSCFIWTRQSTDSSSDTYWNEAHTVGTKSLHITKDDVYRGASFTCTFNDGKDTATATT